MKTIIAFFVLVISAIALVAFAASVVTSGGMPMLEARPTPERMPLSTTIPILLIFGWAAYTSFRVFCMGKEG